jgi:hypothetical protein
MSIQIAWKKGFVVVVVDDSITMSTQIAGP